MTRALLPLQEALSLAKLVSEELTPLVKRIKVVGSVRRKREKVADIEFLVEPNYAEEGLFREPVPVTAPIRAAMEVMGRWVKGGERQMVVTDLWGRPDQHLELYLVHPPAQWGSLLAIRTGPAELSQIAVTRMLKAGLKHVDGHVLDTANVRILDTPEEEDFFRYADLPCWPPVYREQLALRLGGKEKITSRTPQPTRP